jgi:putative MATE family efflux protein
MHGEMISTGSADGTEKLAKEPLWKAVKDAIRGTSADYTKINLKRAIFLLAVPMIIELLGEALFAVVDIYFVGKVGSWAQETVGLTEAYLFVLYSVGMGVSMAVTAVVARRIGEGNKKEASVSAVQSIILAFLISVPFAFAGIIFPKELLILMGAKGQVVAEGYTYTQVMLGSNMVIMFLFVINAIFRGAGDAAIAMRVLWVANIINIVLDWLLITGPGPFPALGIKGAAIATAVGRGVGVLMQLWMLFRVGKHIRVAMEDVKVNWKLLGNIVKTSLGGVGQMIVAMASWFFILGILEGVKAVAGATIAMRIMMFTMMPVMGLSNAAAALVGQYLGSGQPDRAESAVWKIGFYAMYYMIGISVIFYFANEWLVGLFSSNAYDIKVGSTWLRIISYSFFVYGWWMVSVQAFNGAGDTRTPTWINIGFFWFLQIPLAYFLGIYFEGGYNGVFWAVFISETSVGLFTLWLFTKGKWKLSKV